MRKGNEAVIEFFEKTLSSNKIPVIVYEAPTGYGKTSIIPILYKVSTKTGFSSRLIHVAPLRSLVEHIYEKRLLGDLFPSLRDNGLNRDDIGYQMMGHGPGKSPYFFKSIITSTIDSFIFNLIKIPVAEMYKHVAHYETPRANIMTSTVMMDEAHLYGGDPGVNDTSYMFTALLASLKVLVNMLVPLLVATATLPQIIVREIIDSVKGYKMVECRRIRVMEKKPSKTTANEIVVEDKDYYDILENVRWSTKIINELEINQVLKENNGSRVLIVRNTPKKAISTYRIAEKVVDGRIGLIHGLMRSIDRKRMVKELEETDVLIGTQVIEVGINVDFDILITDAASLPAMIQRAGRIARHVDSQRDAKVYIISGDGDQIYDEKIVLETLTEIARYENLDWRIYCTSNCSKPNVYMILEKIYAGDRQVREVIEGATLVRLWELAVNPSRGFSEALRYYRIQCIKKRGFIRSNILLPVVFSEKQFNIDLAELSDNSVPLSIWKIRKALKEDILDCANNKCKIIAWDLSDKNMELTETFIEKDKLVTLVEKHCPLLPYTVNGKRILLHSLIGRIEKYNETLGLEL